MDFFKLKEHNTDIKTEFNAGFTTFLTMLYVVPVNAIILSKAGMPMDALITATALITIFATILNGLIANTPIAMSVGMGLNAYFTFGLVHGMKIPWETALGIVFLSGFIFLILSFTQFRIWILKSIPLDLIRSISAGIGAFISFIGLKEMGIITYNEATLVGLGNLGSSDTLLGLFGLLLVVVFWTLKIKGAFIVAVIIASMVAWIVEISPYPTEFVSLPASIEPIFMKLDILSAFSLALVPAIITLFITQLFDSVGTLTGVGNRAKLFDDKDGIKKFEKSLMVDAGASTGGSLLGVSTTITFAESASGVEEGGRTGLTAVFTGVFFILTLFMLPLFKAIPPNAIYPVLVMVGVMMFSELGKINFSDPASGVASFFIVMLMPLTYSITNGLAFGFLAYVVVKVARKEWSDLNLGIVTLSAISFIVFLVH